MLDFDSSRRTKELRAQFSDKIDAWNITVLDALILLSLSTSSIFAIFSIISSKSLHTIVFSLIYFGVFLIFKFVKEYLSSKEINKTSLLCIVFWFLFISYVILLNVFYYDKFAGYLFAMVQILMGLVLQLTFVSTFIISSISTCCYILVLYFVNKGGLEAQELLIASTSYVFVLLGSNIITGTREVELNNLSRLEKLSTLDSLTKLLNRRTTQYLIDLYLSEHSDGYLLVIDVDNFKNVNDKKGHLIGDIVLKDFSNRLFDISPENSIVGRVGGDEFVVFIPLLKQSDVETFAKLIQKTFNELVKNSVDENISLSIGISKVREKDNFNLIFARADLALYDVKLAGKDSYSFYVSEDIDNNNPTMLIVDDTFVARQLLKSYFDKSFNIIQAENGNEALKKLSHHQNVSIIILDMKMPIMDGSQFLEIYRNDPVLSKIPVVAISADSSFEAEALIKGAKDMIVKPFDVNIVKMRVNNVLQNSIAKK
ncbi:MAG: diguanylate cyclase domain-containing protein [Pleomorphochaeta sp.]